MALDCYDQFGWAVSASAILATRDGGDTWSAQDSGYPNATFIDVDFNGHFSYLAVLGKSYTVYLPIALKGGQ